MNSTDFHKASKLQAVAGMLLVWFAAWAGVPNAYATEWTPRIVPPETSFTPANTAVVVNEQDSLSVRIGNYYQLKRNIPKENILRISFDPGKNTLTPAEFKLIKFRLDELTPAHVRVYALTWANTYRVGCMSITSAISLGYHEKYCAEGCNPTEPSPYFNSASTDPLADFGIRPSMMLAAADLNNAIKLIDRGALAGRSLQVGTAYLLTTSDDNRNIRKQFYPEIVRVFNNRINVIDLIADTLENKDDVLFYFTGAKQIASIENNQYLPGAVADHLTSSGGQLTDSQQMSSMRWLEAGATGSYGTVVEPCNFPQKFSHPGLLMHYYLNGATLVEAYWKSVEQPGQGIFIGEPLAQPFGNYRLRRVAGSWEVEMPGLDDGLYQLQGSHTGKGPWETISWQFLVKNHTGWLSNQEFSFYRVVPILHGNW